MDPQGQAWEVTYCLRRYRPKGMRRAVCGWAAFDKAWSLQPGDAIGFERRDDTACHANAERLSVCVVNREAQCTDEVGVRLLEIHHTRVARDPFIFVRALHMQKQLACWNGPCSDVALVHEHGHVL